MAFESVNYQCPACGGPLHFASAEQKLVCDYCDSRFEVEEVEALYRERQDKADAKADAAAAASKPASTMPCRSWPKTPATSARRAVPSWSRTALSP
ncbi:MAG: Trm112 family protein [Collinsella sp.]